MSKVLVGGSAGEDEPTGDAATVKRVFLKRLPDGPETLISEQAKFTVLVDGDVAIIVEHGEAEYRKLTLMVPGGVAAAGGSVRVGTAAKETVAFDGEKASGDFESGTVATAIAMPLNGYCFKGWYEDSGFETLASEKAVYEFVISAATTLYAKFAAEPSVALHKWEGSAVLKRLRWRSKVYELTKPANLTSVRVDSTGYRDKSGVPTVSFKYSSFSSPDAVGGETGEAELPAVKGIGIDGQAMRRLPARRPERYFQVEISNDAEIDAIVIGTSGEGLAAQNGGGGR